MLSDSVSIVVPLLICVTLLAAHSMSLNDFTEQIFDDAIIDNKITAISAKDMKNHHDFLYPYNLTVFRSMSTLDNVPFSTDTEKYENSKSKERRVQCGS